MKRVFTALMFAVALLTAVPSQAQIKFGLKGGLNVTSMSLSKDVVDKSNQTGFFVGPTVKVTLPLVGLGVEAAALYDQRDAELNNKTITQKNINVPINLRYGIGLGSLASVYLAAGPQFGFNVGGKNFDWKYENMANTFKMKDSNFSVNVGAGVSVLKHLEVGFTYNIACGKTGDVNVAGILGDAASQVLSTSKASSNAWQVSAAYYF